MTQAEHEALFENNGVKVVRHVPVKRLKTVVRAYRSVGAHVVSKPEQGMKNEYVVKAQFG
jgi:hypothetical protein